MPQGERLRVGVLFGGRSSEHEVSLASARNVMDALRNAGHEVVPIGITPAGRWLTSGDPLRRLTGESANGHAPASAEPGAVQGAQADTWALLPHSAREAHQPVDVIFPVLHGPYGEDGTVQGMLEMANLPYVGCGVLASAVAMDKAVTKKLFAVAGLPQADYRVVMRREWERRPDEVLAGLEAALGYPTFVKPANLGSSVGISKAKDAAGLRAALALAARYDGKMLVEQAVPHAREIEVSVLGNDEIIASAPGEIVPGAEFYDYAAKYLDDTSELVIPAPVDEGTAAALREMAVRAFRAVEGSGLARVDFLVNGETGEIFINELNTMPGFTRISMYPKLWEAAGIPYADLVDRLLRLALERFADRRKNVTTRD